MKLPSYVRPYPKIWKWLPFTKNFGGNAIYPYIFLREDFYKDLLTDKPQPRSVALLKHETYHRKRTQEVGVLRFFCTYLLNPKNRLQEELAAYAISMREWKK